MAEDMVQAGTATEIAAYGIPLTPVIYFNYMGRIILASDDD